MFNIEKTEKRSNETAFSLDVVSETTVYLDKMGLIHGMAAFDKFLIFWGH